MCNGRDVTLFTENILGFGNTSDFINVAFYVIFQKPKVLFWNKYLQNEISILQNYILLFHSRFL